MRKTILSAALVLCVSAPALAADRVVGPGREFATIQAAVDAAEEGDRVVVTRGIYRENVVVAKSGIEISGQAGAIVDGVATPGVLGTCIQISGNDVAVTGLSFRAGTFLVQGSGNRLRVTRCVMRRCSVVAVQMTGMDNVVSDCSIRSTGGDGIQITGVDTVVTRNQISGTGSSGISVNGEASVVTSNTVRNCGNSGVVVTGDGVEVSRNVVSRTSGTGLRAGGSNVVVSGNRVTNASTTLFDVNGDDARVTGNIGSGSNGTTFIVEGDRMTVTGNVLSQIYNDTDAFDFSSNSAAGGGLVEGNRVSDCIEYGFDINTNNVTYRRNVVTRSGSEDEYGFFIGGTGNVLEDCTVTDADDTSFFVSGTGNTLRRCHSIRATNCGFQIAGTNATLVDCTASSSTVGVGNRGSGTTLTRGVFSKNRFDICRTDAGTWTAVMNPRFTTGGPDVIFSGL